MAPISLPEAFETSYQNYRKFPKSIVPRDVYGSHRLRELYKRLRERALELLVPDNDTLVPVKDVLRNGKAEKTNLDSDAAIKQWLGDNSTTDPQDSTNHIGPIATKEDPACRFM